MRRLAIFVEGHTEIVFVRRLVEELAGVHNVVFYEEERHSSSYLSLTAQVPGNESFLVLIVNCRGDTAVLSSIRDRYAGLESAGYECIIGLRDLYPLTIKDLPALRAGLHGNYPVGAADVEVVVAVHEVEAWFVQEDTHFPRVDAVLTRAKILTDLGWDIETDQAESLPHPAAHLHNIYRLAGRAYRKKRSHISSTISALDFAHLYLDRRPLLPSFDAFCGRLEAFFAF